MPKVFDAGSRFFHTFFCNGVAAALLFVVAFGSGLFAADSCQLNITLVDDQTGKPVVGLIRVKTPNGKSVAITNLLQRGAMLKRSGPAKEWHCLVGPTTVSVPRGQLTIEGFSGLETEMAVARLDLSGKANAKVTLRLKRFFDAKLRGWRSANTHVHTRRMTRDESDSYLQTIGRADDLELIFVSHLLREGADKTYTSNGYTKEDLHRLSTKDLLFENGEEHRHNFGPGGEGFGHVMLLNLNELVRPVSVGPGIMKIGTDAPQLAQGIQTARGDGGTVIWCHNMFGLEDIPNWLDGRVHAQNIFDGGNHGSYKDTFYRYLNLGLRVPFSTGTDWFIYDFSRVYADLNGADMSSENWLNALRSGRTFISNGPLLDLQIGDAKIGETIRLTGPGKLQVRASAQGRSNFSKIELIRNGKIVASANSQPDSNHFTAELSHSIDATESGWMALRVANRILPTAPQTPIRGSGTGKNELGEGLFAHTSPIYIQVGDSEVFDAATAAELLREMEKALLTIQIKGVFANERERERVSAVYEVAILNLANRIASAKVRAK